MLFAAAVRACVLGGSVTTPSVRRTTSTLANLLIDEAAATMVMKTTMLSKNADEHWQSSYIHGKRRDTQCRGVETSACAPVL